MRRTTRECLILARDIDAVTDEKAHLGIDDHKPVSQYEPVWYQ